MLRILHQALRNLGVEWLHWALARASVSRCVSSLEIWIHAVSVDSIHKFVNSQSLLQLWHPLALQLLAEVDNVQPRWASRLISVAVAHRTLGTIISPICEQRLRDLELALSLEGRHVVVSPLRICSELDRILLHLSRKINSCRSHANFASLRAMGSIWVSSRVSSAVCKVVIGDYSRSEGRGPNQSCVFHARFRSLGARTSCWLLDVSVFLFVLNAHINHRRIQVRFWCLEIFYK